MTALDITITSKHGQDRHVADANGGVADVLWKLGLEYKTADYLHDGEVVITIRPSTLQAEQERARFDRALADIIEISENTRGG
jgi:hypothetical protein